MTPKEQYEARKAERKKLSDMDYQLQKRTEEGMMLDTLDRFVTAVERIADALDRNVRQTPLPDHQLDDASPAGGHSPQP